VLTLIGDENALVSFGSLMLDCRLVLLGLLRLHALEVQQLELAEVALVDVLGVLAGQEVGLIALCT
jgi:hypothetical protein